MAEASGCGFRVFADTIPIRAATRAICAALAADPLRLIASGALLIACADGAAMCAGLTEAGITANVIGDMTTGPRVLVHADGREEHIDVLDRDEVYRVLEVVARS